MKVIIRELGEDDLDRIFARIEQKVQRSPLENDHG